MHCDAQQQANEFDDYFDDQQRLQKKKRNRYISGQIKYMRTEQHEPKMQANSTHATMCQHYQQGLATQAQQTQAHASDLRYAFQGVFLEFIFGFY